MHKVKPSLWIALFFIVLTAIGLLTAADYGLPCDEPAEQVILQENIKEYAYQILGADSKVIQYYDQLYINRISESIERDHGQSAYYLAAPLLALADTAPELLLILWHVYTWLWFMAGVLALYVLARELQLNRILACATSLVLYLSPRFFAEGHYNSKDVVLLSLVLCTLATGAHLIREPSAGRAILFSLAGALATNTKIVGAFAWGLMGIAMIFTWCKTGGLTLRRLKSGALAIISYAVIFAIITPAMWENPLDYFTYVLRNATGFSRWTGVVLFKGILYDPTHGLLLPHSYLPTMIAVTVPIVFLLLMAIGQVYSFFLCLKKDSRTPLLLVLSALWFIPVAYVVIRQPLMYNGWRHFYFIYAGLAAMGGIGLQAVFKWVSNHHALQIAACIALALFFSYQAIGIAVNHPFQYAYFNALAKSPQTDFELDYWDVSTVNAMKKLSETQGNNSTSLMIGSRDEMSAFGLSTGYSVLDAKTKQRISILENGDAPYLFYNTTYAKIYGTTAPEGYKPLFSLASYGNTLCTVYQKTSMQ